MNSRFSQTEGNGLLQFPSFIRPVLLNKLRQSSLSQLFGSPPDHGKYVSAAPVTLDTNVPSVATSVPSMNTKLFDTSAKQDSCEARKLDSPAALSYCTNNFLLLHQQFFSCHCATMKHRAGLRWHKTVLNHLIPSFRRLRCFKTVL